MSNYVIKDGELYHAGKFSKNEKIAGTNSYRYVIFYGPQRDAFVKIGKLGDIYGEYSTYSDANGSRSIITIKRGQLTRSEETEFIRTGRISVRDSRFGGILTGPFKR